MKKNLTILFLFVSSFIFSQSLSDLVFGGEGSFEVVTWNLQFFPKNNQTTIDSTMLSMLALNADVYALQKINAEDIYGIKGIIIYHKNNSEYLVNFLKSF